MELSLASLSAGAIALCVLSWCYSLLTAPGFHVANKHVFITGGSSGLGLALAKQYARRGAKVTIVARDADKLEAAKHAIESQGSGGFAVLTIQCDVTKASEVQQAITKANAFHSRVTDHVVCNAGVMELSQLIEHEASGIQKMMDVNFFGSLHTVQAALPAMVSTPLPRHETNRRIVFVSSAVAVTNFIGYAGYSATKFAIRGLSDNLRNELKLYNIETSIFFPGAIDTPLLNQPHSKKPAATKLIDSLSLTASPDSAAKALVNGLWWGRYAITNDFLIEITRTLANGVQPRANTPMELILLPIYVVIQTVFVMFYDGVVKFYAVSRNKL